MTYLQNWMVYFYPERADLFERALKLAQELGGELKAPHLSWKYFWIKALFGWPLARRAQVVLPRLRWSLTRLWDKTIFQIADRRVTPNPSA